MNLSERWKRLVARGPRKTLTAAARAAQADVYPHHQATGIGADWSPTEYGDYYAQSVPIFSAISTRADALSQIPWKVHRATAARPPVEDTHPAQQLLDQPNPWFSGAELRRATETYMCLWGRAYWTIEDSEDGERKEIWPVRPDRMVVIPGRGRTGPYIQGYLYHGTAGDVVYLPEEVEMFRFFNPLQDRTGLSPIAPLRMSADMGKDALSYNRNTLRNGAIPDYILLANEELTSEAVEEFYKRWEERFQGPNRANRPGIASFITDVKPLAFSNRDMEFLASLRWTVKDAARVFRVPETMLAELQYASLANMEVLERWFWRSTIKPQANIMAEKITHSLLPKLGHTGLEVAFNYDGIEALNESREERIAREKEFLDRGVVTINEVRLGYDMAPVSWGNEPHFQEANPFQERKPQTPAASYTNGKPQSTDFHFQNHG